MNKTNFEKLKEFHLLFNHPCPKKLDKKYFDKKKLVKLRLDLIEEEFEELKEAVKNKDMIETIDALADILYVVYGMGVTLGVDLNKAFDIVHKSNMSKLCKTLKDAEETVNWYKKNQLHIYDSPSYKKSTCGEYFIVYNKSTGKILKNVKYTPAKFDSILN